jgi:branched-chain amino acid transport system permease protein
MATMEATVDAAMEVPPVTRQALLRRAWKVGLLGGVVGVYLAATGILERFNNTNIITGVLTLGPMALFLTSVFAGYLASKMKDVEGRPARFSRGDRLQAGLVAGAMVGLVMGLFVLLFSAINLRGIFVSLSPNLVNNILGFGVGALPGALIQLGLGTGLGLLGGALHLLRPRDRRALIIGVTALLLIGLLEQVIRVMMSNLELPHVWLYTRGGLTVSGAVIVFVVVTVLAIVASRWDRIMGSLAARRPPPEEGGRGVARSLSLAVGLGALGLSIILAVLALLEVVYNPLLLLVTLVLGLAGAAFGAVSSRRATASEAVEVEEAVASRSRLDAITLGRFAGLASLFVLLPLIVGTFLSQAMVTVGIYVLLALGLNIVIGYAGLLDLGYVAFFAVGAYSVALLTALQSSLVTEGVGVFGSGSQVAAEQPFTNFWIALPITIFIAVIAGVLIGAPVLRLRGDYLAIVTLGFGEIVRVIVRSDWAAGFLGGSQGIKQIQPPPPEGLNFRNPQNLYYLVLIFSLLAIYVAWRLQFSRVGRAWAAMREDEDVAEAMGISVVKYKLLAFAMGAAVGCLSGAFFATNLSVITPDSFELLVSITVLSAIILGGMGSITGVIVGAAFLVGLPELLRDFAEYRLLFYGAILVGIMILRPEGLIPSARRRRELRERELEEDQAATAAGVSVAPPVVTGGSEEGATPPEGGERP